MREQGRLACSQIRTAAASKLTGLTLVQISLHYTAIKVYFCGCRVDISIQVQGEAGLRNKSEVEKWLRLGMGFSSARSSSGRRGEDEL